MTLTGPAKGTHRNIDNTRWLVLMCICQLFIMLVFINYSAVLPLLRAEWGMSNTQAGMIFSVYQLGYIASGVILSTLTDRMNTRTDLHHRRFLVGGGQPPLRTLRT